VPDLDAIRLDGLTLKPRSSCILVSMAAAERVALQLPPRRAALDAFKKPTISRAEAE